MVADSSLLATVTVSPLMVAESAGSVTFNGSPDLRVPEVVPNDEVTVELFAKVVLDAVDAFFVQLTNRAESRPRIVMAIIIFFFMFNITFKPSLVLVKVGDKE
jgi:hypothetical protein